VQIVVRNPSYLSGPGYWCVVVLDRSLELLPGIRDVTNVMHTGY
jgi:hypothetical protein